MEKFGYLLITVGFLGGSYFIVKAPETVAWNAYFVFLGIGIAGVVLARVAVHNAARSEGKLATDVESISTSLGNIAENAGRLDAEKDSINVYDLRHRIEDSFQADIQAFVEARESIIHRHGLKAYAEVMSHFAAAERHLNRVWSASTDGYIDEAHTYIAKSAEQFRQARGVFEALKA
jgi:hypothetical protein